MTLARLLRLLLALALLGGQQAALSHQAEHLGDADVSQKELCAQHGAMDTVSGALDAPPQAFAADPVSACLLSLADRRAADLPGLSPSSRGPPALL